MCMWVSCMVEYTSKSVYDLLLLYKDPDLSSTHVKSVPYSGLSVKAVSEPTALGADLARVAPHGGAWVMRCCCCGFD